MSVVLFYSPFNQRSRDTESLMLAFRRQGHRVISLSQQAGSEIHDLLENHGIETHSFIPESTNAWVRHLRHLIFLIRFCRTNGVDVVYSHLEAANFIASMAQFFMPATVYICRHHTDQYQLLGFDKDISYKLTYQFARNIIVFSEASRKYMIENEGIQASRIRKINLAYDFSLYPAPDAQSIDGISKKNPAEILLITVGSLYPLKRPDESLRVLKALVDRQYNARLILLGKGDLNSELKSLSRELGLEDRLLFAGYVNNVLDYLAASSFVLHPSVSESSCVAIKEAGLVKKPVIVCQGVGDFDDYVIHGVNGFLVDPDKYVEESVAIIEQYNRDNVGLGKIGAGLREAVIRHFDIKNVIDQYNSLNQSVS